jgi:hypothetical protein
MEQNKTELEYFRCCPPRRRLDLSHEARRSIQNGKTINPPKRIREAKTWLPHIEVIAMKPFWNVSKLERMLHEGLANYWHEGEWFKLPDLDIQEFLIDGFKEFYEKDRDTNSVDFIYWYNGSGMTELQMKRDYREASLKQFQRQLRGQQA